MLSHFKNYIYSTTINTFRGHADPAAEDLQKRLKDFDEQTGKQEEAKTVKQPWSLGGVFRPIFTRSWSLGIAFGGLAFAAHTFKEMTDMCEMVDGRRTCITMDMEKELIMAPTVIAGICFGWAISQFINNNIFSRKTVEAIGQAKPKEVDEDEINYAASINVLINGYKDPTTDEPTGFKPHLDTLFKKNIGTEMSLWETMDAVRKTDAIKVTNTRLNAIIEKMQFEYRSYCADMEDLNKQPVDPKKFWEEMSEREEKPLSLNGLSVLFLAQRHMIISSDVGESEEMKQQKEILKKNLNKFSEEFGLNLTMYIFKSYCMEQCRIIEQMESVNPQTQEKIPGRRLLSNGKPSEEQTEIIKAITQQIKINFIDNAFNPSYSNSNSIPVKNIVDSMLPATSLQQTSILSGRSLQGSDAQQALRATLNKVLMIAGSGKYIKSIGNNINGFDDIYCRIRIQQIKEVEKENANAQLLIKQGKPNEEQTQIISDMVNQLRKILTNYTNVKSAADLEIIQSIPVEDIAANMLPEKLEGSLEQQALREQLNNILSIAKPGYCIDPLGYSITMTPQAIQNEKSANDE